MGIPIPNNSSTGSISFDPVRSSLLLSFVNFEASVKNSIKLVSGLSIDEISEWRPGDPLEPTLAKVIFQEATNWHLIVSSRTENSLLSIPIFVINGCHVSYLLSIFVAFTIGEYFPPSFIFSTKKAKESASFPRILLPATNPIQEAINATSSLPDVIINELVSVRIFPIKSWLPEAIKKAKWRQSEIEPNSRHSFVGKCFLFIWQTSYSVAFLISIYKLRLPSFQTHHRHFSQVMLQYLISILKNYGLPLEIPYSIVWLMALFLSPKYNDLLIP